MFGEIFSMKNILILFAIMFSMSIVMNSFNKDIGNNKKSNQEDHFSNSDVKEMFTNIKDIKGDLGKLTKELKELTEKLNPNIEKLKKKSLKKVKSKKEEDVSSSEEDNHKELFKNRKKGKKKFEEKFIGYNSQYGQDYLLLDD